MGCHTWFSVPYITDKETIIQKAKDYLSSNESSWLSESKKQMYQYAIDAELVDPVCELAYPNHQNYGWDIYMDIKEYSLIEYNKKNGTNYGLYDREFYDNPEIESYSDEPRIGGYPETVIKSYDELIEFMKTGYTDKNGKHFDFYYDESRKETFMNQIKSFFNKHPKGIITFG